MTQSICFIFADYGYEVLLQNVAYGIDGVAPLYNGITTRRQRYELSIECAARGVAEQLHIDVADSLVKLGRIELPKQYLRTNKPTIYDFWSTSVTEDSPVYVLDEQPFQWFLTEDVINGRIPERLAGDGYVPYMVGLARTINGW